MKGLLVLPVSMQSQRSSQGVIHDRTGVKVRYRAHGKQRHTQHSFSCPVQRGSFRLRTCWTTQSGQTQHGWSILRNHLFSLMNLKHESFLHKMTNKEKSLVLLLRHWKPAEAELIQCTPVVQPTAGLLSDTKLVLWLPPPFLLLYLPISPSRLNV